MKKNIQIPFHRYTELGGPGRFMSNLKDALDKKGFAYLETAAKPQAIFFPIIYDLPVLEDIKSRGGRIIQRLDGVYYPEKFGENYTKLNEAFKHIYQNLADFVVFQSQYSRAQCFQMFGRIEEEKYAIICNGGDDNLFEQDRIKTSMGKKIRFITSGMFTAKDLLEPIIGALDKLVREFDFELTIAGPMSDECLSADYQRDYIIHTGEISKPEMAKILRDHDIFLFSKLNPPCPNSVIEAILSGLPVVGFKSGAMAELCHFSQELLADTEKKLYNNFEDLDPALFSQRIRYAVENYEFFRQKTLDHREEYKMELCAEKYMEVFNGQMSLIEKRFFKLHF